MSRRSEYVLKTVEERGVRLIRLWFTDVLGQLKSVAISPAELETVFSDGLQFDGSAIDGFSRMEESDVLARPDAGTFELLPWAREDEASALMFCDIENVDGTPFEGDPRQVLRRNLSSARDQGFEFLCAPEIEYFYFRSSDPTVAPEPIDQASYFDLTTADVTSDLRKKTLLMLEAMSIPVEYSFHEDGPSQHEIDLQYSDALSMADNVMTLRLVVRKIAQDSGVFATFIPKPLNGVQGSGMHTHLSLFQGETNAFYDEAAEDSLSLVARQFIAGLLVHAREISAVTNQLINSYKRLNEGYEAPQEVTWARTDRSALVRVPNSRPNKRDSTRVEYRAVDAACNPYLAFSLMLAAGLKGVEQGLELPEESHHSPGKQTGSPQALPKTLAEALSEAERSELVRETLGDHIFEWFLRNRWSEWEEYSRQVTAFERERYLPIW